MASLHFLSLNACCYAPAAVENKALRVSPLYYDRGQQVAHSCLSCWVVGAEPIIFNRGRIVASWTLQRCQPLRFERNDYDILLPLRLLRYMSRSLRQRRIPNSPKNSCCKRLKQAVAANRVISENKTCTLLNILPPLVIHISSFPLTSSLCVAGWPNFGGSAYCVDDWLTSRRVF